jgi:hypothetical protein
MYEDPKIKKYRGLWLLCFRLLCCLESQILMSSSKGGKRILLSEEEGDRNLDYDIDDYEDSRIELRSIGLNLVIQSPCYLTLNA